MLAAGIALNRLCPAARTRRAELALIGILAAALPLVPARYDATYTTPASGPGQPTMTAVRRLRAHRDELASPSVRLASSVRPTALCYYLSTPAGWCSGVVSHRMRGLAEAAALDAELRRLGATHAYLDETVPRPAAEALETSPLGWRRVGPPARNEPWVLLRAEVRPAR
jgi:hypothetical protein